MAGDRRMLTRSLVPSSAQSRSSDYLASLLGPYRVVIIKTEFSTVCDSSSSGLVFMWDTCLLPYKWYLARESQGPMSYIHVQC